MDKKNQVCVFLADGFEEIEGLTVADILRRGKIDVAMVSITGSKNICGSHGITVLADKLFEEMDFENTDMLVLPGGMPGTRFLGEHEGLKQLLVQAKSDGKWIGAICAAPSVPGQLGLLQGERAVCYPGFEDQLTGAEVKQDEVAVSGKVITSRGMGTAIPFALSLLAALQGEEAARKMAEGIIFRQR